MALLIAGLIAAIRQLLAVVLVTTVIWLLSRTSIGSWLIASPASTGHLFSTAAGVLLRWCYLLIAAGISLTRGQRLFAATQEISGWAKDPKLVAADAEEVYGRSLMTSIVLAIPVLSPAPDFVSELSQTLGLHELGAIAWAGAFSLGVAGLGTTAHAGQKALYAVDPTWRDRQD